MYSRKPLERKVEPATTALIVVDVQNDFVSLEGVFAKKGEDMSMIQEMVPRLIQLIDTARRAGVPIVYFQNSRGPWTQSEVQIERMEEVSPGVDGVITEEGSWGAEFYQGISPREDERVTIKHRYSGFVDTELDLVLRSRGIKTLVMTGVATNVCVESTARDGYMKDYRIVLVKDCCATTSKELQEATLENIERYFGVAVSAKEVISVWEALGK